jgi:hypothetical protein
MTIPCETSDPNESGQRLSVHHLSVAHRRVRPRCGVEGPIAVGRRLCWLRSRSMDLGSAMELGSALGREEVADPGRAASPFRPHDRRR